MLFVCLGNICRSPTAHGIFEQAVKCEGLDRDIQVDSCGTGDWHIGHSPDKRATAAAMQRGVDLTALRARQISVSDFDEFHYIMAMDEQNLADLKAMQPAHFTGALDLFLRYTGNESLTEVPDPYYGGDEGFSTVFDMLDKASSELLAIIKRDYSI